MTRRAIFFVGAYRPEIFGIGRYVPHYVDALAGSGWEVQVFAPYPLYPAWKLDRSHPKVSLECGGAVRVTRYAPYVPRRYSTVTRSLHEVSIALHATALLYRRAREADLVVVTSPPALASAATAQLARHYHKPFLVLAYDLVADLASDAFGRAGSAAARALHSLEVSLYRHATEVIALTNDMGTRIGQLAGRTAPIPIIRIWADDELFSVDYAAQAREFRRALGVPADRGLVGFAGSFGRKQHLPELVAAMRHLPQLTTVFVGDGPERPEMERLAKEGPGDVRILPPQTGADLHAFLTTCDVSLVTAWTQHAGSLFPSKVANILAAGCPILAITRPGTELATILEGADIGTVCPTLDAAEIGRAVTRSMTMGRDTARRERCRNYATAHFDRTRAMATFVDIANRLVSRP